VAEAVATTQRLDLLAALTEADSLATGASAWGSWKAGLVDQLVQRVRLLLDPPVDPVPVAARGPEPLAGGNRRFEVAGDTLVVVDEDRPGLFSKVAGVLALHGLEVLAASTGPSEPGWASSTFRVVDPRRDEPPWDRVRLDLHRVLDGRLAVRARLAERGRTYGRPAPLAPPTTATVTFHDDASSSSTVIDVHAPDGLGLLYRITCALAELDLHIRSARAQTLGGSVVDAFYVQARDGGKVDADLQAEIELAILHSLSG